MLLIIPQVLCYCQEGRPLKNRSIFHFRASGTFFGSFRVHDPDLIKINQVMSPQQVAWGLCAPQRGHATMDSRSSRE